MTEYVVGSRIRCPECFYFSDVVKQPATPSRLASEQISNADQPTDNLSELANTLKVARHPVNENELMDK